MKKIILGGLLLVICVMMVITLVPGGLFGDYFGSTVDHRWRGGQGRHRRHYPATGCQRARMIGRQQFRGNVPPTLMPFLMQRAADGMITQGALAYEADRMGLGVSDKELADYLHQGQFGQMFFPGGNFIGQQQYEDFVQNQFGLERRSVRKGAEEPARPAEAARGRECGCNRQRQGVEEQVRKQDTKVKFDYAVLTLDDVKKQIKVTDVELKAFYDQNKQQYRELHSREAQGALHRY